MEIVILIGVGLLALLLMLFIGLGALVMFPLTIGLSFVGWLVAGHTGAMVGLVLSGIIGAIVIGVSSAKS